MKTFKNLVFESHGSGFGQQAILEFDNGYGVSVLFGDKFYSNGIDTYELAVLKDGFYVMILLLQMMFWDI